MASPRELVRAVAENLGVSEATVIVHDRNLAEAGLRTVAGRGRAAARVTPADAANLLIAVAMSRAVRDSAATVQKYGALAADRPLIFLEASAEQCRGATFADALACFIELLPAAKPSFDGPANWIEVEMSGPVPEAKISWKLDGLETTREYRDPKLGRAGTDFFIRAGFTQSTIGHVGEAVAGA